MYTESGQEKVTFWNSPSEFVTNLEKEQAAIVKVDRDLRFEQDKKYLFDLDPIVIFSALPQCKPIGLIRLGHAEWRGDIFGEFGEGSTIINTREGLRSVMDWWTDDAR